MVSRSPRCGLGELSNVQRRCCWKGEGQDDTNHLSRYDARLRNPVRGEPPRRLDPGWQTGPGIDGVSEPLRTQHRKPGTQRNPIMEYCATAYQPNPATPSCSSPELYPEGKTDLEVCRNLQTISNHVFRGGCWCSQAPENKLTKNWKQKEPSIC